MHDEIRIKHVSERPMRQVQQIVVCGHVECDGLALRCDHVREPEILLYIEVPEVIYHALHLHRDTLTALEILVSVHNGASNIHAITGLNVDDVGSLACGHFPHESHISTDILTHHGAIYSDTDLMFLLLIVHDMMYCV